VLIVEFFSTLALIIGSSVLNLVLGTTWAIRLPPLSIAPQTGILSLQPPRPWELGIFLSQWRFLFLPPIKVSSISTTPPNVVLKVKQSAPRRIRCKTNQADF